VRPGLGARIRGGGTSSRADVVATVGRIEVTPRDLAHRRRTLFTMLTALAFRYPPGHEPPLIAALR
jgi:hypothetical protein